MFGAAFAGSSYADRELTMAYCAAEFDRDDWLLVDIGIDEFMDCSHQHQHQQYQQHQNQQRKKQPQGRNQERSHGSGYGPGFSLKTALALFTGDLQGGLQGGGKPRAGKREQRKGGAHRALKEGVWDFYEGAGGARCGRECAQVSIDKKRGGKRNRLFRPARLFLCSRRGMKAETRNDP